MATRTRIMAYKAKRKLLRTIGGLGFWGGAVFLLLDVTTPFPTPVRGAYAAWWLLVVAGGAVFWVLSRRLPNLELIDLADTYNGELTIPTVMQELSLPMSMSVASLEAMACDDLAGEIHAGRQRIWVFYGVDDDNRLLVKTIQEARAHGGEFTVAALAEVLGVSPAKARTVLARAENEGYANKKEPDQDAEANGEVWTIHLPPIHPGSEGPTP